MSSVPPSSGVSARLEGEQDVVRFITQVLAHESPEDNAQRLGLILGHMPGYCYVVDRDLVFTSSLGAGLAGLELENNQLVGTCLLDLWGTRDEQYQPYRCHLEAFRGTAQTYQDVCLGRSLEYQLIPLRDGSGLVKGVLGLGFDVTAREQAKERETTLLAQLRQAQKLEDIGRLAGGVAHDFNNLLTCIMGHLTLAEEYLPAGSEGLRHLAECNRAADSAASLTRQLLAFGRKQVIHPRVLNLTSLIKNVEGMLSRLIGEAIELRTDCASDLWLVKADPGQLEQVLVNLVVNARDALAGRGRLEISTQNLAAAVSSGVLPAELREGDYVVLAVRDTGPGMSDVVKAKLFEPFFTTKGTGEGTGLGLATVYGAAQQNGGAVSVESQLGAGATFKVFLPRSVGDVDTTALRSEPPPPEAGWVGGTETILLVEDEPLVLELAHCSLRQLGYQVLACAGPDEALRTLENYPGPISLLVTDVVMPRMNGKELAGRVSSLRPGISVLYSSGYGEKLIATEGVVHEGLNFISKPYRPADLGRQVRLVLDARSLQ